MARARFGELLVAAGVLSEKNLRRALRDQTRSGGRLGRILVDHRFVDEEVLYETLARVSGLARARFSALRLDPRAARYIDPEHAEDEGIAPIGLEEEAQTLWVAVCDPTNVGPLDEIAYKTGLRVRSMLASEREFRRIFDAQYPAGKPAADDADAGASLPAPGHGDLAEDGPEELATQMHEPGMAPRVATEPASPRAVPRASPPPPPRPTPVPIIDGGDETGEDDPAPAPPPLPSQRPSAPPAPSAAPAMPTMPVRASAAPTVRAPPSPGNISAPPELMDPQRRNGGDIEIMRSMSEMRDHVLGIPARRSAPGQPAIPAPPPPIPLPFPLPIADSEAAEPEPIPLPDDAIQALPPETLGRTYEETIAHLAAMIHAHEAASMELQALFELCVQRGIVLRSEYLERLRRYPD